MTDHAPDEPPIVEIQTWKSGQRVLIEAQINEVIVKPGQLLVGVRILGNGRVMHISVPVSAVRVAPTNEGEAVT